MTRAAPLVSVVIPCRNEAQHIEACVLSILSGTYKNLEVLVVDGLSEDGTRDVLARLVAEGHGLIRLIDNPARLTPFAFNAGVRAARGQYVQIVGSHNLLAPDYIELLVQFLESRPEVACVGGDYQHIAEGEAGRYISRAMQSRFGVGLGNYRTRQQSGPVDTVGIPLLRRAIFDEVGYFDERLVRNQDDEFSFRLKRRGYGIYYLHPAKTQYVVRSSFGKLFRQMTQYGYFKVFVNVIHRRVTTLRQLVPALFVLGLAGGLSVSLLYPRAWVLGGLALLLGAYWALGLVAALQCARTPKGVLLFQWAAATMHVGYGLGYLRGVLDFVILRREPAGEMTRQTA